MIKKTGRAILFIMLFNIAELAAEPFVGEVRWVAFNFAPRGWAFCDGQILPINKNNALFALLGTTYGGDGRTTFRLPDLKASVPMHSGTSNGHKVRLGQNVKIGGGEIKIDKKVYKPSKETSAVALKCIIALDGMFPPRS